MRHKEKEREREKDRAKRKKKKELDTCKARVAQLVHNIKLKDYFYNLKRKIFWFRFQVVASITILRSLAIRRLA